MRGRVARTPAQLVPRRDRVGEADRDVGGAEEGRVVLDVPAPVEPQRGERRGHEVLQGDALERLDRLLEGEPDRALASEVVQIAEIFREIFPGGSVRTTSSTISAPAPGPGALDRRAAVSGIRTRSWDARFGRQAAD